MPKIHQLQSNFSSGTLDPTMRLRVDTGAYQNGAKTLHNLTLLNTGGAARRAGTRKLAKVAAAGRLQRFEFDEDEVYGFFFYDTGIKFYGSDGTLLQTTTSMPWTSAQLDDLTFESLGDVMLVFHPEIQTRVITRTSLNTFAVSTFVFETEVNSTKVFEPHFKFAADTMTLYVSAATGSINITASSAFWEAGHVGTRIRIFNTDVLITSITSPTIAVGTVQGTIQRVLQPDALRTTAGTATVTVTEPFHGFTTGGYTLSGIEAVGGITAANLNGARVLTVLDEHTFTFPGGAAATSSADGGGPSITVAVSAQNTRQWTEPAFSAVRGWPRCGGFHGNRLWLAGSPELPAGLFASKVGRYFNFDLGEAEDTDAIATVIGQDRVAAIRHLVSSTHLQIFTTRGEYYIPRADGQPITPGTITVDKQTPYGISAVTPFAFDNATLFLQASKAAVREFIYSDQERKYAANSISLSASHVLDAPVDMAVVYGTDARPEQYCYLVNDDGTIAVFHSARVERLAGWTTWDTDGTFLSATTVDNTLWLHTQRGADYFIEALDETMTLDCATDYTNGGTPKTSWTVSSDYRSKDVYVVARREDGGEVCWSYGELTVSGADVLTLPVAVDNIAVGFNYTPEVVTLPPVVQDANRGTLLGEVKRICAVNIGLHSTMQVEADGQSLVLRQVDDDLSEPPEAFTGFSEFRFLGYDQEPEVSLTQTDPLPLTILGLVLKVSA